MKQRETEKRLGEPTSKEAPTSEEKAAEKSGAKTDPPPLRSNSASTEVLSLDAREKLVSQRELDLLRRESEEDMRWTKREMEMLFHCVTLHRAWANLFMEEAERQRREWFETSFAALVVRVQHEEDQVPVERELPNPAGTDTEEAKVSEHEEAVSGETVAQSEATPSSAERAVRSFFDSPTTAAPEFPTASHTKKKRGVALGDRYGLVLNRKHTRACPSTSTTTTTAASSTTSSIPTVLPTTS